MDIATILQGYLTSKGLPIGGNTLQGVSPDGRLDVLASATVEALAANNPIMAVAHALLRPQIDGVLNEHLGPVRLKAQLGKYVNEFQAEAALTAGSIAAEKELNKRGIATRARKSSNQTPKGATGRQAASAPKGATEDRAAFVVKRGKGGAAAAKRRPAVAQVEDVIDLEAQPDGSFA